MKFENLFPNYIKNLKPVVIMQFGSHLYGTATENSDLDFKGIFLPTQEEILLNNIPKSVSYKTNKDNESKNTSEDIEIEMYSIHYFIKLACEGQTVALDMLHAPNEMLIKNSIVWKIIQLYRKKFYTKNLKAFIGYARRQASKYGVKGSRLDSGKRVLEFLEYQDPSLTLRIVWDKLPRGEHIYTDEIDPNGNRMYQVCGKKFPETCTIGHALKPIETYCTAYGKRAREAKENKNIDWKAISHAMRAALQIKQLLTENTITFPLKEADYLLEVKQGKLDYMTEVSPKLEFLMEEVEMVSDISNLPEKVNTEFWDDLLVDILKEWVFK